MDSLDQQPVVNYQTRPNTPSSRFRNLAVVILMLLLVGVIIVATYYAAKAKDLRQQIQVLSENSNNKPNVLITPQPRATNSTLPTPYINNQVKDGQELKTYSNTDYRFEIKYPARYQMLTDSQSLSSWPNAIALLYDGVQSYGMPIEVWNNESEYKSKYVNLRYEVKYFKSANGKIVTLININNDPAISEILKTFKFIN